eukprot:jgi/Orpsp1_1/1175645/evm.model.c7180000054684.1
MILKITQLSLSSKTVLLVKIQLPMNLSKLTVTGISTLCTGLLMVITGTVTVNKLMVSLSHPSLILSNVVPLNPLGKLFHTHVGKK